MPSSYPPYSFSLIFVFGTGCILPFAMALPRPAVPNTDGYHFSTLQTDSASPNISSSTAPSSTSLPARSSSSSLAISSWMSASKVTPDTRAIAEALGLFVLFTLIILAVYWFGPSDRHLTLGRQPAAGPGFGFDGLTKSQLKAVRLKEKDEGMNGTWFIKLPAKPPTIALKEFPLPPIQMPMDIEGVGKIATIKRIGSSQRCST